MTVERYGRAMSLACKNSSRGNSWVFQNVSNNELVFNCLNVHQEDVRDIVYRMVYECTKQKDLELCRRIQISMCYNGLDSLAVLADPIIRLFSFCGRMAEANHALARVSNPSLYTWNGIIDVHAKLAEGEMAFNLYNAMDTAGKLPNRFTFLSILKLCCNTVAIVHARKIHEQILACGLQSDIVVGSCLVDMYGKCGRLDEAHRTLDSLPNHNVVSWGAMIAACVDHEESHLALEYFEFMQQGGIEPDKFTFSSILKAYGSIGALTQGRYINCQILEANLQCDMVVGNTLVDMYSKCGSLKEAHRIFIILPKRDVVTWNSMIAGYTQHGDGRHALECFVDMMHDTKASKYTFSSILKACGLASNLEQGRSIHEIVIENRLQHDIVVRSALVDMYAKCGSLWEALRVFDECQSGDTYLWNSMIAAYAQHSQAGLEEAYKLFEMLPRQDVESWNILLAGYTQHGKDVLALECFEIMQHKGIMANEFTFSTVLKACSNLGALEHGRSLHKEILARQFHVHTVVGNTLLDMYAKCGSLDEAHQVFRSLPNPDTVSWGAMITAFAQVGAARMAFQCFEGMQHYGIKANDRTFSGILTAFSYAGFLDEAHGYFNRMKKHHEIVLNSYHITCMVDLLGNAGFLEEAINLLYANQELDIQVDIQVWMTLLSACNMHCNVDLGKRCFDAIVSSAPFYAPAYVLMSNIYATELGNTLKYPDRFMNYGVD